MLPNPPTHEEISFRNRLSIRLLRNVFIAALILELLLASVQICFDYYLQENDLNAAAKQVLGTAEGAATHAVWTLDNEGGQDLLDGLLQHDAIVKAELIDFNNKQFSSSEKSITHSSPIKRWVFGGYRVYELDLQESFIEGEVEAIGALKLTFDTGTAGTVFFKRTISFLTIGLIMNLLLAAILLYVFHLTMARSILSVGDALDKVNPERPGRYRIEIPSRHSEDELGRLVNKTNDLLRAVGENIQSRQKAEKEVTSLNQELEARVETRTRELKIANQELKAFSYSVSHDLRGPVRGIKGLAEALLEDYGEKLNDEGIKCLQLMQTSSMQMDALINGLLKLSQSTQGGIAPERVNLSSLAMEIFNVLSKAEPERMISIDAPPGIEAVADPKLIKIVLDNLIKNAWKYTRKSTNASIEFGVEQMGDEKVYFVRDNGVGFDMSLADRLFVPFQRLHADADFHGTGIGLATVARIIYKHGGRVWADSVVEEGATFRFSLGVC